MLCRTKNDESTGNISSNCAFSYSFSYRWQAALLAIDCIILGVFAGTNNVQSQQIATKNGTVNTVSSGNAELSIGIVALMLAMFYLARSWTEFSSYFMFVLFFLNFWVFFAALLTVILRSEVIKWSLVPILLLLMPPGIFRLGAFTTDFVLFDYGTLSFWRRSCCIFLFWQGFTLLLTSITMIVFGVLYKEYFGCFIGFIGLLLTWVISFTLVSPFHRILWKLLYSFLRMILFVLVLFVVLPEGNKYSLPNTMGLSWLALGLFLVEFLYFPVLFLSIDFKEAKGLSWIDCLKVSERLRLLLFLLLLSIVSFTRCLLYGIALQSIGNITMALLNFQLIHMFYLQICEPNPDWKLLTDCFTIANFPISVCIMANSDFPWLQLPLLILWISPLYCFHFLPVLMPFQTDFSPSASYEN